LALGTQTKNTLCFAKGNFAYLSRMHPDLGGPRDFAAFKKAAKYFLRKKPKLIAYDLHSEYEATKYALGLSPITYSLSPIQHHHAHIASCMAECSLRNQKVIGVAFDGTGLGADNTLWGGEFLLCDYKSFRRKARIKEIPLIGGQAAIREPGRLSSAWLYLAYKEKFLDLGIGFTRNFDRKKWRFLKRMYLAGYNCPATSSMGRLFDAAAALILVKYRADFEAELAMELEKLARGYKLQTTNYRFKIMKSPAGYVIDPLPLFRGIVADLKRREPPGKIAYKFHLAVAQMIRDTCLLLRRQHRINRIVLSGGVFQNKLLLSLSLDLLYKEAFRVITHARLSCNDSGVSLGQAVIANWGN